MRVVLFLYPLWVTQDDARLVSELDKFTPTVLVLEAHFTPFDL